MSVKCVRKSSVAPAQRRLQPYEVVRTWLNGICAPIADRHGMHVGIFAEVRRLQVFFRINYFSTRPAEVALERDFWEPIAAADLSQGLAMVGSRRTSNIRVELRQPSMEISKVDPGTKVTLSGTIDLR